MLRPAIVFGMLRVASRIAVRRSCEHASSRDRAVGCAGAQRAESAVRIPRSLCSVAISPRLAA
eukprot:4287503-Alexandrium_andersonii.AAC.1